MPGRGLTRAMSMPSARFLGGASGRTDRRSTTGLYNITSRCDERNAPEPPGWAYFGLRETRTFDAGQTAAGVRTPPAVQAVPAVEVPPNTVRFTLTYDSVHRDAVVNLLSRLSIAGKRRAWASLRPIHAGLIANRPAAVHCLCGGLRGLHFLYVGSGSARKGKT